MNLIRLILITLFIFTLASCEDDYWDSGIGPCVHNYMEPILHITTVRDTIKNYSPSFVILHDLRINGNTQISRLVLVDSYSIVAKDSLFYCNVPFGFGSEEGTYEFTVEAEGYELKYFKIDNVEYSIFQGGCPSYNDGGKRVELNLN